MPLLRTRPRVRLRAPRDVVPGQEFEIGVLLDAKEPVEIEWCDVRVEGRLFLGQSFEPVITPHVARLCSTRQLPTGTTTLSGRLTLDPSAPRSHSGRITYTVSVHASVPWWPDTRGEFALHVVGVPGEPVTGQPRVAVSSATGPTTTAPYAELSIGKDVFEPGEVIDGRVAMKNVGHARTTLSLVAYETVVVPGARGAYGPKVWTITLAEPSTTFAFAVPADITPSFRVPVATLSRPPRLSLEYWLVAEAHGVLRPVVTTSLPVQIVDRGSAASKSRLIAPHVGDERLDALFAEVASMSAATVEPGPSLVVRRGDVVARMTRELTRDGAHLAVAMAFPSSHLELHVHEPTLVALAPTARRVAKRAGLSERCVVTARDTVQAAKYLAPIAPPLKRARHVDMTDTALRYVVPSAANGQWTIATAVRDMTVVAQTLATVPPPMPTAIQSAERGWSELTSALNGTFEPGHARVAAANDDAAIEVTTQFDGARPSGTTVTLRPTRELRLDVPIDHESGALAANVVLSPDARIAIERLAQFGRVRVDASEIRVSFDAPLGDVIRPSRAREIVEAAQRLAIALHPSAGPFR